MKNPIKPVTGAGRHVLQWLTTPPGERVYVNSQRENDIPSSENSDNDIAVLYIHGTADRACGGKNLALKLRHHLPSQVNAIYLISFRHRYQRRGIEEFSKQLIERMKTIGAKQYILIGHSRGGLVAAYTAQQLRKPDRHNFGVEMVITLSAPFNGSHLALKELQWFSKSVREMHKNSSFLQKLRKQITDDPACRYEFLSGTQDLIVHNKAKVEGYLNKWPNSEHKMPGHGHLSITSAKSTIACIADIIRMHILSEAETCHDSEATLFVESESAAYSSSTSLSFDK